MKASFSKNKLRPNFLKRRLFKASQSQIIKLNYSLDSSIEILFLKKRLKNTIKLNFLFLIEFKISKLSHYSIRNLFAFTLKEKCLF